MFRKPWLAIASALAVFLAIGLLHAKPVQPGKKGEPPGKKGEPKKGKTEAFKPIEINAASAVRRHRGTFRLSTSTHRGTVVSAMSCGVAARPSPRSPPMAAASAGSSRGAGTRRTLQSKPASGASQHGREQQHAEPV